MSRRTDTLRDGGARERGGGPGNPFVKWPDKGYTWLEGELLGLGESRFGPFVTVAVEAAGGDVTLEMKVTEEGEADHMAPVEEGVTVNVGVKLATLKGKFTEEDVGRKFHVAFEGWQAPQAGGDPYRVFTVLDLGQEASKDGGEPSEKPKQPSARQAGPGAPGAEGPPVDEYEHAADDLPFHAPHALTDIWADSDEL